MRREDGPWWVCKYFDSNITFMEWRYAKLHRYMSFEPRARSALSDGIVIVEKGRYA